MKGAIAKAEEMVATDPETATCCCSSSRTRPIRRSTSRRPARRSGTTPRATIDVLVSGVGTGGTITGVSRYIKKEKGKKIVSVAVEPVHSPVITQTLNGEAVKPGPHKIQGIGAGFIPDTLDLSMVDRVEQVTNDESIEMARRLAKEEGILAASPAAPRPWWRCGSPSFRSSRARRSSPYCRTPPSATSPPILFDGMFTE